MSDVHEIIRNAQVIRERLRCPPNAVKDIGIDLKRKPPEPEPPPVEAVPPEPPKIDVFVTVMEQQAVERPPDPMRVDIKVLLKVVSDHFFVGPSDIRGPSRLKSVVLPRHVLVYLAFKYTRLSSIGIGNFVRRDHTSALHGRDNIAAKLKCDPHFAAKFDALEDDLLARSLCGPAVAAVSQ